MISILLDMSNVISRLTLGAVGPVIWLGGCEDRLLIAVADLFHVKHCSNGDQDRDLDWETRPHLILFRRSEE